MRISFLCGFRALEEYRKKSEILSNVSGLLTTNQDNVVDYVSKLKTQVQSLKTQLSNAKQMMMECKIKEIPTEQRDVLMFEKDIDAPVMRAVLPVRLVIRVLRFLRVLKVLIYFKYLSNQAKNVLCHRIPFCGFNTQWFSSGKINSCASTPRILAASKAAIL